MADVSSEELKQIIRRAAELQFAAGEAEEGDGVSEEEVVRIGREVGLEPGAVRQAMAEVRAASLRPSLPEEDSLASRLLGSGFVRASRFVAGSTEAVRESVESELELKERLRKVRQTSGGSRWVPAEGWKSAARRSEMSGGHAYELGTAKAIEVSVREADEDHSLVTVTADVRNQRTEQLVTWISGLGVPGLLAGGLLVAAGGFWAFLSPLPVAALVGAGTWATVPAYRRERERLELVVEGFLDRLERALGARLPAGERPRRAPPFF